MPRISRHFSTLGRMAVLASLGLGTACGPEGNGPSNTPPAAAFTTSCDTLTCTFADGSSDADGQVIAYAWDFGDGTAAATTKDAQHTYAAANTYTVSLTVTDDGGAANGVTKSVQVTRANVPPTANFTSSCAELECSFTDLSSDGDGTLVGFDWDFGDGAGAAIRNPIHAYASAGIYVVRLTVTDNGRATASHGQQVTVTAGLTPTIWLSPTSFRFCYRPGSTRNCVHLSGQLSISNVGNGTLNWEAKSNQSWLGVSPTSGTAPSSNVTVSVHLAGLPRGTYFGSITVSAAGASNSPQTVSVRLDY